jgi:hypothetical protein
LARWAPWYPNRIDLGLGRTPGTDQAAANAIRSDFRHAAMSFPNEVSKIQDYFSLGNSKQVVRANNTNLEKAHFSTAYNFSIDPSQNRLTKAKFSHDRSEGLLHKYQLDIDK